jgi:hypothetical protein
LFGRDKWRNTDDGRLRIIEGNGSDIERMGERKKIHTTNVICFRAIKTRREGNSRINLNANLNVNRVYYQMEASTIINQR